jgi:hypothetical protein
VLAGIRRALQIFAGVAVPTALFSLLLGLAFGTPVTRALATGFYLVGSLIMVVGILSGVRGPVRSTAMSESDPGSLFGMGFAPRRLRKATEDERRDALSTAVLFLILGLVLVSFGVVADTEVDLL